MITLDTKIEAVSTPNVEGLENILNSNRNIYMQCNEPTLCFNLRFEPTMFESVILVSKSPLHLLMTACLNSSPSTTSTKIWELTINDDGKQCITERLDLKPETIAKGPFDTIRVDIKKNSGNRKICISSLLVQKRHSEQYKATPKVVKMTTPSSDFYSSAEKSRSPSNSSELKPTKLFNVSTAHDTSPIAKHRDIVLQVSKPYSPPPPVRNHKTPEVSRWNDSYNYTNGVLRTENSYNDLLLGCVICPQISNAKLLSTVRRICDVTGALYLEDPIEGITHLLTEAEHLVKPEVSDTMILHVKWLLDSFSSKKKLDEAAYVLSI